MAKFRPKKGIRAVRFRIKTPYLPLILHIYRLSQSTLLCVKYGGKVYICITKPINK